MRRSGQGQPNYKFYKVFGGYLLILVASTSSSCSVFSSPMLSSTEKAKLRVSHEQRSQLAAFQQCHSHDSSDQFLLLLNPTSTLTHSCLHWGGKSGFCCCGSQVAPTLEMKRIQESNRAEELRKSCACSFLFLTSQTQVSNDGSEATL